MDYGTSTARSDSGRVRKIGTVRVAGRLCSVVALLAAFGVAMAGGCRKGAPAGSGSDAASPLDAAGPSAVHVPSPLAADAAGFEEAAPVEPPTPAPQPQVGFTAVSAGFDATCAIVAGGDLYCWGGRDRPNRPTEPLLREVAQVSTGWEHVCAVKTDGSLHCWGGNVNGQLGLGTIGVHSRRAAPERVALERVRSVAASWKHTCAVTVLGELFCWGEGSHGRLGTGDTETRSVPAKVQLEGVLAVQAGEEYTCASTADVGLHCWGYNFSGQLGLGEDWAERASCSRNEAEYVLDCLRPEPLRMAPVTSVATGGSHTCVVLGESTPSCWGWNADQQLGREAPETAWTPLPVTGVGLGRVAAVSASRTETCAVMVDGTLYCWGDGSLGRLGLGTKADRMPPTALALTPVASVSVGYAHACAVTRSGELHCWGSNAAGQLGLGDDWLANEGCVREDYPSGGGRGDRDVSFEFCVGPAPVRLPGPESAPEA